MTDAGATIPLSEVPWFDVGEVLLSADHAAVFDARRAQGPLWRSDFGLHVMTYDRCVELLRDRRFHQGAPALLDGAGITDAAVREQWLTALLGSEPADHDRLRRLVAPSFTPSAIRSLRSYVMEFASRRSPSDGQPSRSGSPPCSTSTLAWRASAPWSCSSPREGRGPARGSHGVADSSGGPPRRVGVQPEPGEPE